MLDQLKKMGRNDLNELSKKVGVSYGTLYNYRNGSTSPSIYVYILICKYGMGMTRKQINRSFEKDCKNLLERI